MNAAGEELLHRHVYTQKLLRTEAFTQRSLYTDWLVHAEAFAQREIFTQRSFYAWKLLHREVFRLRRFCIQTHLHRGTFTHRSFLHREVIIHTDAFAHRSVYQEKPLRELLHTRRFTHRSCYIQTLLHKEVFTQRALTHRRVYRQKLLRNEVFTQRAFTHGSFHTHRSFYTEKSLHKEAFTRRSFFTQKFLHIHEYVQKRIRNIFLKQQVLIQWLSSPPCDDIEGQVIRRSRRWVSALKSGDASAVCVHLAAIALATGGARLPLSNFWGSGAGRKEAGIIRCFWKSILGCFWAIVWRFFFFLLRSGCKQIVKCSVCVRFAYRNFILQRGENCVNTSVLLGADTKTL